MRHFVLKWVLPTQEVHLRTNKDGVVNQSSSTCEYDHTGLKIRTHREVGNQFSFKIPDRKIMHFYLIVC